MIYSQIFGFCYHVWYIFYRKQGTILYMPFQFWYLKCQFRHFKKASTILIQNGNLSQLEHVKGLSRRPLMLMIRAPSNPTANVLHTPAQVPHFRSLLTSSGCPVTRGHSYPDSILQPETTRYFVRRATERANGYRRGE